MGGTSTGAKKAKQLKFIADEKHRIKNHTEFSSFYNQITKLAERAAGEGHYEVTLYDDKFLDPTLVAELKRAFKEDGFKVEANEDAHYSEHVGKPMMYVRVSWK